jgi:phospholipase A1
VKAHRRLHESSNDDNPDLTRNIGNTEITASWLPGQSTASLTLRSHLRERSRGSLQLDWTHPVDRSHPEGLRWYAQIFTGYGETLLDYNHKQTSVGLGLTLFQF